MSNDYYGCNNCEWNQKWFYSQFEWTPNWIAAIKKFTNAIEKYRFVSSFVIGCFKQSPFILRHFERCIVRYCRDRPLYSFSLCFLLMFSSLNYFISLIYFRFYSQYRCAYCLARAYYNWTELIVLSHEYVDKFFKQLLLANMSTYSIVGSVFKATTKDSVYIFCLYSVWASI